MSRREFISLIGGAAASWSLAARAQQKVFLIGYLDAAAASNPTAQNLLKQFLLGLRDVGDVEGRQFRMETRNADGHLDRLPALAADLARIPVDLIVTGGEAPIRAAMQATDKVPIVMTISADPIRSGFVASLARPGGNITGMSALASEMASKRIELLKEIVPHATRVSVLWNPNNKSKIEEWNDTQTAAKTTGLMLISAEARSSAEIETAFALILHERPDAMITLTESLTLAHVGQIGRFALSNRLPMFAELREFVVAGGLASYGASRADLWRRSASYVHRIMHGVNPGDLPVEQPTKFELVINVKTAKAIGLNVAPSLLTRADEVIE
jgi:ABC-type uncharacterized transport system substrate-binding protein